jgi:NADH-quinone oxidoreductase subunit E
MLRGAEALKDVCRRRIHHDQFHLSDDGNFSWEEVECAGACANAPMVQIFADTYEDLTPALLEKVLDGLAKGQKPQPGSQTGRKASAPAGGATTLKDPSLYDGSMVGAWRKRFDEAEAAAKAAAAAAPAAAPAPVTAQPAAAPATGAPASSPSGLSAGAAATAAASLIAGAAKAAPNAPAVTTNTPSKPGAAPTTGGQGGGVKPATLAAARGGVGDDLKLIWGVGEKLEKKLNDSGIWHFDQIARWTPLECLWIETHIEGMLGRIERDRWLEQANKLASGWRPDSTHGRGQR